MTTLVVDHTRTTEMVTAKHPRITSPNKVQLQMELAEAQRLMAETRDVANEAILEQRIAIVTETQKALAQQREEFESTANQFEAKAEQTHRQGVARTEQKAEAKMGQVLKEVQTKHKGELALRDRTIVATKAELQKTTHEVSQKNQELNLYQGALANAGDDSNKKHAELRQVPVSYTHLRAHET